MSIKYIAHIIFINIILLGLYHSIKGEQVTHDPISNITESISKNKIETQFKQTLAKLNDEIKKLNNIQLEYKQQLAMLEKHLYTDESRKNIDKISSEDSIDLTNNRQTEQYQVDPASSNTPAMTEESVNSQFQYEEYNPNTSADLNNKIQTTLTTENINDISLVSTECRNSTCLIELSANNDIDVQRFADLLFKSEINPKEFLIKPNEEQGSVTMYLSQND